MADRTVRCSDYEHYREGGVVVEFGAAPAVVRGLVEGRTYFAVVEARNFNVLGYDAGASLPARVVPRGAFDSAPRNLRVTGVLRDTAFLRWEAAPAATHYKLQYRIPAESPAWYPTAGGAEIITTATEYVLSLPLTTDKTYEFRVLARDLFEQSVGSGDVVWAGEAGHASNVVSATPVVALDPVADAPGGLAVTGHREHEVLLAWAPVPRARYFVLQLRRADRAYAPLDDWADVQANDGEPRRITGTSATVAGCPPRAPRPAPRTLRPQRAPTQQGALLAPCLLPPAPSRPACP